MTFQEKNENQTTNMLKKIWGNLVYITLSREAVKKHITVAARSGGECKCPTNLR